MKKKIIEFQTEIQFYPTGRGGRRPNAGRKKINPKIKKKIKSFTLSTETIEALEALQRTLGLPSQTATIEFIILKSRREMGI